MTFQPGGGGDSVRPLVLRDSSRGAEGVPAELGRFNGAVVEIVASSEENGLPDEVRQGNLQPRNWHESETGEALAPELKGVFDRADRRFSVALIADHQHRFEEPFFTEPVTVAPTAPGATPRASGGGSPLAQGGRGAPHAGGVDVFLDPPQPGSLPVGIFEEVAAALAQARALGADALAAAGVRPAAAPKGKLRPDPSNPFRNGWSGRNRSTPVVDYRNGKGRTGLLSQLAQVVDSPDGAYSLGLVLGPDVQAEEDGGDALDAGFLLDAQGHEPQAGYLSTVFRASNPADVTGRGVEGTPWGILGIRHDAHFEYEDETHGRLLLDPSDVSARKEPTWPIQLKIVLGFDPSRANEDTDNRHESGQWRPIYDALFFVAENPSDGAITTAPGEDHEGIVCDDGGCHGILVTIPLCCEDGPDEGNLIDECFGYIALHEQNGHVVPKIAKGGGTWGFTLPEDTISSGGDVVVDGNGAFSHPPGFIEGG